MGKLMTDTPLTARQQAVYWTEYAIRHEGATHLQSVSVNMPWYQLLLLDVLAVLITIGLAFIWLITMTIKVMLMCLRPKRGKD